MANRQTGRFHRGMIYRGLFAPILATLWCAAVPAAKPQTTLPLLVVARTELPPGSIAVQVRAADAQAHQVTGMLAEAIRTRVLAGNPNLRAGSGMRSPIPGQYLNTASDYVLECTVTRFQYQQSKVTQANQVPVRQLQVDATYRVFAAGETQVFDTGSASSSKNNLAWGFLPQENITPQVMAQQAVDEIALVVANSVADVSGDLPVRLMEKDELKNCTRLAQAGEWSSYIDSVSAIPAKKNAEFEGDRRYDLAVAYEALGYQCFRADPDKAGNYFRLAETNLQEAQKLDPREQEYVRAFSRVKMAVGSQERYRSRMADAGPSAGSRDVGGAPPGITNADVIEMVKSGLDEEVILTSIRTAERARFDVSPAGLVELHRAGVPKAVITEIQRRAVNGR